MTFAPTIESMPIAAWIANQPELLEQLHNLKVCTSRHGYSWHNIHDNCAAMVHNLSPKYALTPIEQDHLTIFLSGLVSSSVLPMVSFLPLHKLTQKDIFYEYD